MITTGDPGNRAKQTEIVDLKDPATTCQSLADFPSETQGTTGGLLAGGTKPLVCGEYDRCLVVGESTSVSLDEERKNSASIVLPDGETLWITGGQGPSGGPNLESTEYVTLEGSTPGPDLPNPTYGHCLIQVDESTVMLVGGVDQEASVYTCTIPGCSSWTQAPSLLKGRYFASCGTIRDSTDGSRMAVVAGGYSATLSARLDSVEFMDLDSMDSWTDSGISLPRVVQSAVGLTSGDGRSFYVIGGFGEQPITQKYNTIYQLQCFSGACSWTTLTQTLQVGRGLATGMLVPDSMVSCSGSAAASEVKTIDILKEQLTHDMIRAFPDIDVSQDVIVVTAGEGEQLAGLR